MNILLFSMPDSFVNGTNSTRAPRYRDLVAIRLRLEAGVADLPPNVSSETSGRFQVVLMRRTCAENFARMPMDIANIGSELGTRCRRQRPSRI